MTKIEKWQDEVQQLKLMIMENEKTNNQLRTKIAEYNKLISKAMLERDYDERMKYLRSKLSPAS